MLNELVKYLIQYRNLSLPGIGNFYVETKPAELDFVNRSITSKQNIIAFSNEKPEVENRFYNFLSGAFGTDESNAKNVFDNYAAQLSDELNSQQKVYLRGIGTLTKSGNKTLEFIGEAMPVFFPELIAEKVIRKNATHAVRVGEDERTSEEMHVALQERTKAKTEKWVIAAGILAVIGIMPIVLYYTVFN